MPRTEGRVEGKVALVTGAASGIGKATATLLAEEGARVAFTDIDGAKVRAAAAASPGETLALSHDVTKEEDWRRAVSEVVSHFGRLDILVNNAGTNGPRTPQDPESAALDVWDAINTVNVNSVVLGCRIAIPVLQETGGGAIVNIASLAGAMGTPTFAPYGAGKAAVRQFTKSVALHCAAKKYNIRCNAVLPGFILTPMSEQVFSGAISRQPTDPETMRQRMLKTIPMRKFGTPEDIAYAVLYLVSEESAFVTGTEIVVDGGVLAAG